MKLEDLIKNNDVDIKDIKYLINKIKTYEDYVFLYLDDDKIQVSIDDYFKYNLSKLKGLDEDTYQLLKINETKLKAYRSCLRKLSIKDYTIKQIKDHLKKYDIDYKDIDDIVNRLISYGLLDDKKYCISKINYYSKQSLSNKQIKQKLIKQGINSELIDDNLIYDIDLEINKADKLANKYYKSITNKSINSKKQTIMSRLISNGYSYEVSKQALDKLSFIDDNELELLSKEYLKAKNKYMKKYEDYELKSKIYAYLINKGFKNEDIKKVMED